MKTTLILKNTTTGNYPINNVWFLQVILFTLLLYILPTSNKGYLMAGSSESIVSLHESDHRKVELDYLTHKIEDQTTPVVTSLTLIDARTDQDIRAIHEGDIISLAEVGSEGLNIRANISGFIDHVELRLKGPVSYSRTEQVFPYALFGDIEGNYEGKALQPGKYTLKVTPYTKEETGATFTLSFHIIKGIATEPSAIEWDKTFGGSDFDSFSSIVPTSDSGYLLAGDSQSPASGDKSENGKGLSDYWIVKIDANGNKVWDKTFGGSKSDGLNNAITTTDGGYLLGGRSYSDASGDKSENKKDNSIYSSDYWVVKIDAQGNKVWDKTIGGNRTDDLRSALSTPDGGYLLAGYSGSDASGDKSENSKWGFDYWVVKIDAQGNKVWDKTLGGGSGHDYLSSVIATSDGGYLLGGYSYSPASGDKSENSKGANDYWVVKIDAQGNKVWDKTLGGSGDDYLNSVIATSDGGYLLAGTSHSPASGDKSEDSKGGYGDYWVVKIDAQGNKVWDKTIGGGNSDNLRSALSTPDEGYLIGGYSYSPASGDKSEDNKGDNDYWIVKIDAQGNKIWDKTFGGNSYDEPGSIIPTSDGGYLLGGRSYSDVSLDKSENSKGGSDYWIVKIKEQTIPIVLSLTLIDAATDQEIKALHDGDVINLVEVGNGPLNIRANTTGLTDFVELKLKGPIWHTRIEHLSPYALFGDVEGDYEGSALLAGSYTLTVTPYKGIAHTVSFEVIDAPEATTRQVKVYPIPTSGILNVFHEGVAEEGHIVLLDFRGKMLLHQPLSQQPVEQVDLSGFKKGIYYLRVVSAEAVQVFRIAKE